MSDLLTQHARQRAKRTSCSPSEYASAITAYRRPANWASRILFAAAAVLLLAAWRIA